VAEVVVEETPAFCRIRTLACELVLLPAAVFSCDHCWDGDIKWS
jgi:hypothetical protein